jgi:hypothetical protein
LIALCLSACAAAGLATAATPAWAARALTPALAPQDTVIAGPSASITALNGLSVARDGTGALVFTQSVGGVAHLFLSRLTAGAFQPPVRVDAGLAGPSSQPVLATGQGGQVVVAFINGASLYVAQALSSSAPLSAPAGLFNGAANPSIAMSNFGKAYLAFTDTGGGGNVRAAYYYGGQWALESTPLDASAADSAGTGTGRPDVAAAGDGIGIVAWGEAGHVYVRRVIGTAPSTVVEQADPASVAGWSETSAGQPSVASGGDDTYAAVAFQESVTNGAATQSRVLFNRLHGSGFDGASPADGAAAGGAEGADQPQVAVTEYGTGFVTSETEQSHILYAAPLGTNDTPGATFRVDSLPNSDSPDASPSNAGLISNLIAWQQTPGVGGPAEIRVRYAQNGSALAPEEVVSQPSLGAANADAGLATAGDVAGDAAVAWVQGIGAQASIVSAQMFQAPGGFVPSNSFRYVTTASPALMWSPSSELWGPPTYAVRVDGITVGQTTATSLVPPTPLTNGRHIYQLSATNLAGVTTNAAAATVFVDTVRPKLTLKVTGTAVVKTRESLRVRYSDPPPAGLPKTVASGVATVYVNWGDGSPRARIRRTSAGHVYSRIRSVTVTVTVTDRAGNRTVVVHTIKIKPKPKPKKPKKHKKHKGKSAKTVRKASARWG